MPGPRTPRPPRCGPSAGEPSPFVERHVIEMTRARPRPLALDLACGRGRHAGLLADHGCRVIALDRDRENLRAAARLAPSIQALEADAGRLPLRRGVFDLIVQTRFLDRALFAELARLLKPDGLLVVETFGIEQFEATGHPRAAFCLGPGELRKLVTAGGVGLRVIDAQDTDRGLPEAPMHLRAIAARRS